MKNFLYQGKSWIHTIQTCCIISFRASTLYTILEIICKSIVPLLTVFNTFVLKLLVDYVTSNSSNSLPLIILILLMSFILVLSKAVSTIEIYCNHLLNSKIGRLLSEDIIADSCDADLELFDNSDQYNSFTRANQDIYVFPGVLNNVLLFGASVISVVAVSFSLLPKVIFALPVVLITEFPVALVQYKYIKETYHLDDKQVETTRRKNYIFLLSTLREFAMDVRLYNLKSYLLYNHCKYWKKQYDAQKKLHKSNLIHSISVTLVPAIGIGVCIFFLTEKAKSGLFSVSDFVLYSGLITQLSTAINQVATCGASIYDSRLRVSSLERFRAIPRRIKNTGCLVLSSVHDIKFSHVSFVYPGTDKKVLDDVSFQIANKEQIFLVGLNGSGKSTLIKLLLRFYDPTNGNITINDHSINEYSIESLRSAFGVYFQESPNYHFSIKENIHLSMLNKPFDYSLAQKLIEILHANSFIRSAPKGLDTTIGRSYDSFGIELSGGEQQKIALARTFYRNASAYLLDEPSSALDPEAESLLMDEIKKLSHNKMVIFVSHRLINISSDSRVLVLEGGKLIEDGTKKQLLDQQGRFADLYTCQVNKYVTS